MFVFRCKNNEEGWRSFCCFVFQSRLLCCKLTFIPSLCSLAPPTPTPSHAPSLMDHSSLNAAVFLHLSFFPFLFLFLRSLSYMSSHSSTLYFLLLSSSVLLSFLSSCRRGMQPNVKRGNSIVSVVFAAFTPTVCTTLKVKLLQWWTCDRQVDHDPTLTPPTAGMDHLVLEKCTLVSSDLVICSVKRCLNIQGLHLVENSFFRHKK